MTPEPRPSAIGGYEDWPAWLTGRPTVTGDDVTTALGAALGVPAVPAPPPVRTLRSWTRDGVATDEVEWSTGFGPPTRAWICRPVTAGGALPGVLALHCHAGVKSVGAERLVVTPGPTAVAGRLRGDLYEGRAFAEDLARRGFVVLAHDTFAWGSRRFTLDPVPVSIAEQVRRIEVAWEAAGHRPGEPERYDAAAALHEHVAAKAAGLLGTSFAGMVAHDDMVAAAVLRALPGVDPARTGVAGFSGGGGRAATLSALDPAVRASAVVGMMTTTAELFPAHADAHSWLLATPGLLNRIGLPEIAAARLAHRLLVLSFADDALFPPDGVRAAHAELRERFGVSPAGGGAGGGGGGRGARRGGVGAAGGGVGSLEEAVLPGGHVFTGRAQDIVGEFLVRALD